ncbi:hypothetical protein BMT55_04465 [Listeria newyorkensis]|uniref:Uncharacterized protein n=1 Tax=Listeria newyorkensis TaxID=1497681 RepID=A0ABX4XQT4_9LIST|nr:Ig-like domain-containing protein [Listeria newyorkensis]KGL41855.1 hypothetical protein EP58_09930 [Listeria newyorkensis]PNP94021.1 hypothetical protein BMT55_04465 [Listeria newyorkensis]SQC51593.1 Cell wall-associated protease precursor [Listeria newyorkensis]
MKSKQTNYQNVLSTKKMKQAAKALLVATVMASQVVTVLPTNIFAAETNSVSTVPAGATEVATLADLKTALLSKTITDIKLTADIKLTGSINVETQKNLYGNGHTINMNNFDIQLLKADSVNRVEDLTIINQNIYTLFYSVAANVEVTFKNVSSSGKQCMYNANGTIIIEGRYTGSSTSGEIFEGKNLLIKEGASMDVSSVEAPGYSAFWVHGNLTQEKNSDVKVASRYKTIHATSASAQISIAGNMELSSQNQQAIYADGGDMLVKTGAKFKATGGSTAEEGISITNGNLTVQSGADFTAISKGTQGTVQTGGKLVFENGSNFAITNTNSTGSVFANYAGASTKININSDKGLSTWDSGLTNSVEPTRSYNDFTTATLDLSGWDKGNLSQKNLTSNSAQFQSQFVSKTTAKLFGGSYSDIYIAKTTIDELTTDSIKATGVAEPNATIVIKNAAGTTLGTGKVGSEGYYSITIPKQAAGTQVTATAGNSSATTIIKQAAIAQTTIAPLTTDSTKATGTAEPNANIEIKANGSVIGSGKVGSDGNYSITILQQDVGTRVTATATLGEVTSSATETVTQGDIAQTAIAALTTKSTVAIGTAEPNANIEITANDSIIGSGKVGSDGNYSITIPKQAEGTVVKVTAKSAGKMSIAQTTVVRGEINQTTINEVTTESTSVSGTAEANSTLVVKDSDGKELATGRVGSDGVYSLTIPKQSEGTILTATASLGEFRSTASTIVARNGIDQTTINSLTTDSTSASGTAEPNATIVLTDQDGKELTKGRVGSDGIYSLTIAKQAEGTVVTAVATSNGKTSSANTTVIRDGITPTTIDTLTADATVATGTAEPNAAIVIKDAEGKTIGSGTVGSDGKYSMTIPKQTEGTTVTATATKSGKTSTASTTVAAGKNIAATTISALTTDSVSVSGKAEPNAAIVVKAGSTTIATGIVGSDGNYSLTIPKQAANTVVTTTATKDGKTSSASTTVTQEAAEKSVKDLFNNGDVTGTIKDTTDQAAIDKAQKDVDAVKDATKKAELQKNLDEAQKQLDAKNAAAAEKARQEAAEKSVKDLFNNDDVTGTIKDVTDQAAIDKAQKVVDTVKDATKKAELQKNLDEAQKQLDARKAAAEEKARQEVAEKSVKDLFNNDDVTGTIKDATDQAAIDKAQKVVDAVTDPTKKAELQKNLDEAQKQLNNRNAVLDAPTIDKYTYLDSYVTGKVSVGTATVSLYVNGVRVKRATPDALGNYKFDTYGLGLNTGVTFEVRPVDAKGKEGKIATAIVAGKDDLSNLLKANDAGISTATITGTVGSGIDSVRLSIDGAIVKVGQITNGTYSIATNGLIKEGSEVEVVGYSGKVEVARVKVNIINDEKPVLGPLTVDDDVIKGHVTAGSATFFRVSIGGVAVKTGTIAADGTFQSSIGKQALGTEVKIEIKDANGYNALRVSTVKVTESAVAKLDAPTLERMDGNYIVGTAVKGTETVVIYEGGVAKRTISASQMTTNPDGSLSFRGYVAPGTTNVQAAAKNSDKRMNSELSAKFEI